MSIVGDIIGFFVEHPGFILVGILIYIFIFGVSLLFSGPKPGLNPFRKNLTKEPKPLVTDQSARDKVLKQSFHVKRIPERLDAIVIGSGIGGLSTATILAKSGQRVLVLEQHDQAGGCCHTFIDKGFEFDVGIHYVGEMKNNTINKLMVDQLTEGQLQWAHLDDPNDIVALGEPGKQKMYPQVEGKEQWRKKMIEMFPGEDAAINKYLDLLDKVRRNTIGLALVKILPLFVARFIIATGIINLMTSYYKYAHRRLSDVLDELTDNVELKSVLGYSFGDYGTLPKDTSFAMHAMLICHFQRGGSYPVGGASEIAFHMIPIIERSGGKVLVRAPVTKILIDETGKACGVRVNKGSEEFDLRATRVISAAGAINTFKKLLPQEVADKAQISKLINTNNVKSGIGAMSMFVGLRGETEDLGLKAQNIWAFTGNDIDTITREYLNLTAEQVQDVDVPLLFISFPSAKDPTHKERYPGKSTCTVVTLADWSWFSEWKDKQVMKRGDDYDQVKNAIGHHMWEQVCELYPQLRDKVEYMSVASPASNYHYIASPKGEIYGLDHTLERFSASTVCTLRPEVPEIPNLYLSGQDVFTCGFSGGLFGGLFCAGKILNRNLYFDLVNLKKEIAKEKKQK